MTAPEDYSQDDFDTDSEEEAASDHDDTDMRWKKPKDWDHQVRNEPLLRKLGDILWTAPADRESVLSEDTGMNVEPEFEMKAGDKFLPIFFDALPRLSFFRNVLVTESIRYAKAKATMMSPNARRVDPKIFTVSNFLRLFACIIMRGRRRQNSF